MVLNPQFQYQFLSNICMRALPVGAALLSGISLIDINSPSQGKWSPRVGVGRIPVLSSGLAVQSQRDCALQPKVAPIFGATLGSRPEMETTPTALWPG